MEEVAALLTAQVAQALLGEMVVMVIPTIPITFFAPAAVEGVQVVTAQMRLLPLVVRGGLAWHQQ